MKIPKRFKLYGQTIEVEIVKDLTDKENALGEAVYSTGKIRLQCTDTQPRPPTQQEQCFCHELMHFIMHFAGYEKLRKDEEFIERTSHLLHQALTTMEYERANT